MSLTNFTEATNIIASLGDQPIIDNGLSAAQFKAKFDDIGTKLKTYINGTLIPEIEALFSNLGNTLTIDTSNIADDAIKTAKIDDAQITEPLMADNSIDTRAIIDGKVTAAKLGSDITPSNVGIMHGNKTPVASDPGSGEVLLPSGCIYLKHS